MTFSDPKSPLTSARMFDTKTSEDVAYWLDEDARRLDGTPGNNNHVAATRAAVERLHAAWEALVYVDKSLDNVRDLPADLAWTNREVVEVLEDVRSLLLTGAVTPGAFTQEPTNRSSDEPGRNDHGRV